MNGFTLGLILGASLIIGPATTGPATTGPATTGPATTAQAFTAVAVDVSDYALVAARHSDRCLDVSGNSLSNGANPATLVDLSAEFLGRVA